MIVLLVNTAPYGLDSLKSQTTLLQNPPLEAFAASCGGGGGIEKAPSMTTMLRNSQA